MKKNSLSKKLHNALNDNSGVSLLELIIAVTILAIVTAPLLNTFVISAKMNAKARTMGYETNVATGLYEKVKAADGDFLMETESDGSTVTAGKLKSYFGANDAELTDNTSASDGTVKTRKISLKDITSGNRKYNAEISIDAQPTGSETIISGTPYSNDAITEDNAKQRTKQMSFDHVWMQPDGGSTDPDERVLEKVPAGLTTTPNSDGERIVDNTRRITVSLKKVKAATSSGDSGTVTEGVADRVQVSITYEYNISWYEVDRDESGNVRRDATGKKIEPVLKRIYNPSRYTYIEPTEDEAVYTTETNLETVPGSPFPYTEMENGKPVTHDFDLMLFFKPYYQSTSTSYKDQITVNNPDNLKGSFFAVKENPSDADNYSGLIRLVENHPSERDKFYLTVHTNIGLKSQAGAKANNKQALSGGFFYFVKVYDGASRYNNETETLMNTDPKYETTSLIKQESLDHIYRIRVDLYKSDKPSEKAFTLSGIKVG